MPTILEPVTKPAIRKKPKFHDDLAPTFYVVCWDDPPSYRQQQPRPQKKLGAFIERIKQILKEDQALPRKQRHTAKRIWERLQEDGYTGGYTVVKDAVRELTCLLQSGLASVGLPNCI